MAGIDAIFDSVAYERPKLSSFDGSHDIKTSCQIGKVFPLDCIPVYPKDKFTTKYNLQAKFDALVAPVFQRMNLKQWSFLVRNADLWDDFEEFVSGINPRLGRTAYQFDSQPPVHPHVKCDDLNQFGSSYIGVKLNLSGLDLSKVTIKTTSDESHGNLYYFDVANSVLYDCIAQIMANPDKCFSWKYEDGSFIRPLFGMKFNSLTDMHLNEVRVRYSTGGAGIGYTGDTRVGLYVGPQSANTVTNLPGYPDVSLEDGFSFSSVRGFKPLFSPHSICDYLGYPCSDMKSYVNSDDFIKDLLRAFPQSSNTGIPGSAAYFINEYITGLIGDGYLSSSTPNFPNRLRGITSLDEGKSLCRDVKIKTLGCLNFEGLSSFTSDNENLSFLFQGSNLTDVFSGDTYNCDLLGIILMYILWAKFTGNSTTMVDDCPYFDMMPMHALCNTSSTRVESLRLRAYHKIWNDYFRHPNLTAEIPVPYADGGDDVLNYYTAVNNFLHLDTAGDDGYLRMIDWTGKNLISPDDNRLFPYQNVPKSFTNNFAYIWKNYYVSICAWDLMTRPFSHLRKRDYITGCLPNTAVVDIVAPVMPTDALQAYENTPGASTGIMTNDNIQHNHEDGYLFRDNDKTRINPSQVSSGSVTTNVGWLDIENLRITQKLVNYFKTLRYAMGSFKDFVKSFFDADISDLTLHRAQFLGGHADSVSVSELVSSVEYESNPQGSLAGRASSYGESDVINLDVNDYGFFITLECLSPLESNVGGIDRQMIRDTEFDYFNPKFAELGDMMVSTKEVSVMPTYLTYEKKYDSVFGYTQRYMDLKFIPSKVHGDFLGSLSDWHLDLIQPAIGSNTIKLSQNWLEERSDDRIFAEVFDDTSVCKIWCECRCSFVRALPAVVYDVIA